MRIVQVFKDYYPPTVGGVELLMRRLAIEFTRRGDDATVLCSHPGSRRTIEETVEGVRVIRCGEWARALSTPFCPSMPAAMAKLRADVWHLHHPNPLGEIGWLLHRPAGALVVTWHGDITRQKAALPLYAPVIHAVLRDADVVMTTYEAMAENSPLLRHYAPKCRVVPLGIDLEPFERRASHEPRAAELRAATGVPLVIYVGRLVDYKGVDVLIRAMTDVAGSLLVVGDGPERPRLEALRAGLKLERRVTFAGRVEYDDVVRYLAAADVGVLPAVARQETFGLSMVEMMAHGLPVVCTEVGTGTSFVNADGESGLVVPPRNPEAMAAALNRILGDEPLRRRLGAGARARAHALFSTEAMVRGVAAAYEEAIERRRGRSSV